jgi:hypothetical protein
MDVYELSWTPRLAVVIAWHALQGSFMKFEVFKEIMK